VEERLVGVNGNFCERCRCAQAVTTCSVINFDASSSTSMGMPPQLSNKALSQKNGDLPSLLVIFVRDVDARKAVTTCSVINFDASSSTSMGMPPQLSNKALSQKNEWRSTKSTGNSCILRDIQVNAKIVIIFIQEIRI
jgi:hypothetical protein